MIAVAGEALIDAHSDGDALRTFPGGGPFNTAIALARLGAPACFLGALSRDAFGHLLDQTLTSAGVGTEYVTRVAAPTPLAVVSLGADEPSFSFYLSGTAHEAFDPSAGGNLDSTVAALHIGSLALATDPPGPAVAAFAERESGSRLLVIDPNIRPAVIDDRRAYLKRFERLSEVAGLLKMSASDLAWLYPDRSMDSACERLLGLGATCVVVTHGAQGAEGRIGSGIARGSGVPVRVVDTVGAGDAFCAGLLAWLWNSDQLSASALGQLSLEELEAALGYACAVAAAQCSRASAWGPTAADVEQLRELNDATGARSREGSDGVARIR